MVKQLLAPSASLPLVNDGPLKVFLTIPNEPPHLHAPPLRLLPRLPTLPTLPPLEMLPCALLRETLPLTAAGWPLTTISLGALLAARRRRAEAAMYRRQTRMMGRCSPLLSIHHWGGFALARSKNCPAGHPELFTALAPVASVCVVCCTYVRTGLFI